jgi:hypothetical protein
VLLYIIVLPFPSVYYFCKDSNDEPLEEEEEGEWSQGALTGALPTASSTQPLQAGSNGGMPVFFVVVVLFLFFWGGLQTRHCLCLASHCLSSTLHCLYLAFHCLSSAFHCLSSTLVFIWPSTAEPGMLVFHSPCSKYGLTSKLMALITSMVVKHQQPNPGWASPTRSHPTTDSRWTAMRRTAPSSQWPPPSSLAL